MKQFEQVRATFRPKRTGDLQNNAEQHIGRTYIFEASWVVDEGTYKGQWALTPIEPGVYFGWVPECDLEILETVREGLEGM